MNVGNLSEQEAKNMLESILGQRESASRYYYAILSPDNIVGGVTDLSAPIDDPMSIEIPEYTLTLLGQLYQDGKFIPFNFYAKLDGNNTVCEIEKQLSTQPVPRMLGADIVQITENNFVGELSYFTVDSLVGSKYKEGKFTPLDPLQQMIQSIAAEVADAVMERLMAYFDTKSTI